MTTKNDARPTQDRLALLYLLSQTFNSSLDLNEVMNRVIDQVIDILHAERGFIMIYDSDGSQSFPVARGLDRITIDQPQSQVSQSVVHKVATEGKPILTSDAQSDERFSMRQSVMLLGLRSILCVPLKAKEQIIGVVYADNRFEAGIFTQDDLELLTAIASIAAIAIENARLYQMAIIKGRMERELQMAREMQTSFLPQEVPHIDGWQFAASWEPAREVAGDYFDFIPAGENNLGLVIADVTDKGAPAALFMVFSNSIVRASIHPALTPANTIRNANKLITNKSTNNMFVSLVYMLLEPSTGRVRYVNAGHNPPLQYSTADDRLHRLSRTGMVLGIDVEAFYDQRTILLNKGDFILLYTDGLTDAIDSAERDFGMERLEQIIYENRHSSADEMIAVIKSALFAHMGDTTPIDDITLLMVKRL